LIKKQKPAADLFGWQRVRSRFWRLYLFIFDAANTIEWPATAVVVMPVGMVRVSIGCKHYVWCL
jgi:hypothetical protein